MRYFIFRNATIERFFADLNATFSGYEDVSQLPEAERYIWFYLSPVDENEIASKKMRYYIDLLRMTVNRIGNNKMFLIFTVSEFYNIKTLLSDNPLTAAIKEYNAAVEELSRQFDNVKIVNFSDFTDRYPSEKLIDWRYWFISQMGINPTLANGFASWFASQIRAIELKRKKVLILDLDNTLWGGILGEDGMENLKIGGDYPGNAFLKFQHLILELSREGVILAVCSKNNEDEVKEMWQKHPDNVLKEENFAALKINWNNKADNIREIAQDLNLGLDSFVFFDDNPRERELIKTYLPEVFVPDFPEKPYDLPVFFKNVAEQCFSIYNLTAEDLDKTQQYKANAARASMQKSFASMTDYIKSLNIVLDIKSVNDLSIIRAAAMTQKTNQFNLTTKRYTDADLRNIIANENGIIYTVSVADRFGDSGITGVCIIKRVGVDAEIDTLLLSCRILGKEIEYAFINYVLKQLQQNGTVKLTATYIPTLKNAQVAEFFDKCGFTFVKNDGERKEYVIYLDKTNITLSENYSYIS
ncbi:MAG: HAD-IIIC family phosphatase [Bacteroidales bacterium]|jgi:FkbH-like protein|nr:HAD-IIIC family phosphatase [Bacteroidales bacterium]